MNLLVWVAWTLGWVIVSLASGCATPRYDCRDGEEHECVAQELVWETCLRAPQPPPWVVWHYGACTLLVDEVCRSGLFYSERWTVAVKWQGSISASAYVHEHIHAWLLTTRGSPDSAHVRPEWAREPIINGVLQRNGL